MKHLYLIPAALAVLCFARALYLMPEFFHGRRFIIARRRRSALKT